MWDAFDGYAAKWLPLLEKRPSDVLTRVVSDLAVCPDGDRAALVHRFTALLCGPRAEPGQVRLVMRHLARFSGPAPRTAIAATPRMEELGSVEAVLSRRLTELEQGGGSEAEAHCRTLETAMAAARERAESLRAVLLRAGCTPEELTL
jgi:hypothetical protein